MAMLAPAPAPTPTLKHYRDSEFRAAALWRRRTLDAWAPWRARCFC